MKKNGNNGEALHFSSISQVDVPQGRQGKHRKLVSQILEDLERTAADTAVRVPLSSLDGEKMQNVRSALNRVTRAKKMEVATSADEKYLYVWRKATV
ncbi:MAG TPA: hypothetical protein VLE48_02430 [Terriglobales bacterium]|nr:hypothetical protein [Terriglobales bacterium]